MILFDKTFEELGIDAAVCGVNKKIYCQCDYCGKIVLRTKRDISLSNKNLDKDTCGNKNCTNQKRREVNCLLFGEDNIFKTAAFKDKLKKQNLQKYGVENVAQAETVKNKIKNTCLKKYGKSSYLATSSCKERAKEKSLEIYGVDNCAKSEDVQNKIRKKCKEKYDKEYYSQTDQWNKDVKETCLKKYGKDNVLKVKKIKDKIKQTNKFKHGVDYPLQNKEIHNKVQQTNKEKYGVCHYPQTQEYQGKRKKTCRERYGVDHPMTLNTFKKKVLDTKIAKYGTINIVGKTEKKIKEWLLEESKLEFKPDTSILQGKEIDLFNADVNLGIEFCGLYWHTEKSPQPRDKYYHYDKYKACKDRGIRLLTIFQDEWKYKNSICKSVIRSILGLHDRRIYARNCKVVELNHIVFNGFLDKNHLLGASHNFIKCFGLTYNEELVGVIVFGRHHRKSDKNEIILSRLCFLEGCTVVGGASKLFSVALNWLKNEQYNRMISWSDNRWFEGEIYLKLGFTLEKELTPDYSYVDLKKAACRYSKQSLKGKIIPNNYARLWDCGKKRWILNLIKN